MPLTGDRIIHKYESNVIKSERGNYGIKKVYFYY